MDALAAARTDALAVLAHWQGSEQAPLAPLPIRALIADHNIEIAIFDPGQYPDTLGFLDPVDDDLIWIHPDLPPVVETFTLAHEFAHWRLHRSVHLGSGCGSREMEQGVNDQASLGVLLPDEAYSPRSQREREANAFAAELLAPTATTVARYLDDAGKASTINNLARTLGVSRAVIRSQLVEALQHAVKPPAEEPTARPHGRPQLDEAQLHAATIAAPALVIAGPGTGKTSTLVGRVAWLVDNGTRPDQILALTFSRKAAAEMRERVGAVLDTTLPQPTITTFHSFGADILRKYGHHVGLRPDFELVDEIATFFVLQRVAPGLHLRQYQALNNPTRHFSTFQQAISAAKDELVGPEEYRTLALGMLARAESTEDQQRGERALEIAQVYAAYQQALADQGDADYADLIRLLVKLFQEYPDVLASVQQQYASILVDEFQDINRANGIVLKFLAGDRANIWAVGDANQAIYRFRGASPENIARFTTDYPGAQVVMLQHNYRSRPPIVGAANRFVTAFLPPGDGLPLVQLDATRPDVPDVLQLCFAANDDAERRMIARDINQRLAAGTPAEHIAVLCRTNAHARSMAAILRESNIPSTLATDLFEDSQIKNVLGIFHLLAGEDAGILRAACMMDHPLSQSTLTHIIRIARERQQHPDAILADPDIQSEIPEPDRTAVQRLAQALADVRPLASIEQALIRYCFESTAIGADFLRNGGESALNLAELLHLAARCDADLRLADEPMPWREFITYLRIVRGLRRERLEADDGDLAVKVMTVHAAKGLEWPIVYLPHLSKSIFPQSRRPENAPTPEGLRPQSAEDAQTEHLREEARLFYVAVTRARDLLIMSRADQYGKLKRGASDFLTPIQFRTEILRRRYEDEADQTDNSGQEQEISSALAREDMSASEIAVYDTCPRQYLYRYGYRFSVPPRGYQRMRRAMEAALREGLRLNQDESNVITTFEHLWRHDASQADPFDDVYERYGKQAVQTTYRALQGRVTGEDVARVVTVAVGGKPIRVELDRVEHEQKDIRAVRHQLEGRVQAGDPDLRDYFTLLAQRSLQSDTEADIIYTHHLGEDQVVPLALARAKESQLENRVVNAIQGITAGDFPARPNPRQCATCAFVLICPQ